MSDLKNAAVLCKLVGCLRIRDNWAGETHIQKTWFFLQDLFGAPEEYDFVLHHYGPFSFELRGQLENMLAEGFVELERVPGYGPRYRVTDLGKQLMSKYPVALEKRLSLLDKAADFVGKQGAGDLERISTALYLINDNDKDSDSGIAKRLIEIKPHITEKAALDAVREMRKALGAIS